MLRYLNAINGLGFSIVFVTTAKLTADARQSIALLCAAQIERENAGHDFGSWAVAHETFGDLISGDLLLANDSVYGPLGGLVGLEQIVTQITAHAADFYGMVESVDVRAHLQSWFLLLRPEVHKSQAFRDVLRQPFTTMTKREIVERAEVAITQALIRAGFRYHAAYSATADGTLSRRARMNPTHLLWRELVDHVGMPFVKVELLRDNPDAVPNLHEWSKVVMNHDPVLRDLIEDHLRRKHGVAIAVTGATPDKMRRYSFFRRDFELTRGGRHIAAHLNAACYDGVRLLHVAIRLAIGGSRRLLRVVRTVLHFRVR